MTQPSFPLVSSIIFYFKITRSIFYVMVMLVSILIVLLLIPFQSFGLKIFISLLSMIICLLSCCYIIRLWRYRICLDDQHLTIRGLKTIIIDLTQIEAIDERMVNGCSHLNLYLKGQNSFKIKLYEYLEQYDELRRYFPANDSYRNRD